MLFQHRLPMVEFRLRTRGIAMTIFFPFWYSLLNSAWRSTTRRTIPAFAIAIFCGHAGANEIDGTWQGKYACPYPTAITLIIKETSPGRLQADFVFQVQRARAEAGHFPMHGTYATDSGEFTLAPGKPTIMPPGMVTISLKGRVIRSHTGDIELAMHKGRCMAFELSRGSAMSTTEAYASYSQNASQASPKATPAPRAQNRQPPAPQARASRAPASRFTDSGLCGRVVAWANQLEDEHPFPGSAYRNSREPSAELVLPLFTDQRFLPVVDKTFTDLTSKERASLGWNVRQCLRNANLDKETRAFKEHRLMYPFTSGREHRQAVEFVTAARASQAWRESTWNTLQTRRPSAQTYNDIVEFMNMLATRDKDMWPREQKAFREAIDEKRRESAENALISRVNELLAAAPSRDTLLQLGTLLRPGQLWKDNNEAVVQRETLRIQQERERLFAELIEQEKHRLAGRGEGMRALAWGREWEPEFQSAYAGFRSNPSFIEVQQEYRQLREKDLRVARNDVLNMIKGANEIATLEQEAGKYLDKNYDTAIEAGRDLLAALENRKTEIRVAAEERKLQQQYALAALNYSSRENQMMASPGRLPVIVPATYSEAG